MEITLLEELIDILLPKSRFPFLNHDAKTRPSGFYIDTRVKVPNKKAIYKVVKLLADYKQKDILT